MRKEFLKGFGLIEIVVGAAVLTMVMLGISNFYQQSLRVSGRTTQFIQASFILEEGVEAARILRDKDWSVFAGTSTGVDYYLIFAGSTWATTTTNTFIDSTFERKIVFSDVYRDTNDDIAGSGTLDVNTKKITVTVSWRNKSATTTKSIETYFTNLFTS